LAIQSAKASDRHFAGEYKQMMLMTLISWRIVMLVEEVVTTWCVFIIKKNTPWMML
jgi:hypothetical protein